MDWRWRRKPHYCYDSKVELFTEYQAEIKFGLIQRNFAFICIIILSNLWKTNTSSLDTGQCDEV